MDIDDIIAARQPIGVATVRRVEYLDWAEAVDNCPTTSGLAD